MPMFFINSEARYFILKNKVVECGCENINYVESYSEVTSCLRQNESAKLEIAFLFAKEVTRRSVMSMFGFQTLINMFVRGKLSVAKYTEKGSKSPMIV